MHSSHGVHGNLYLQVLAVQFLQEHVLQTFQLLNQLVVQLLQTHRQDIKQLVVMVMALVYLLVMIGEMLAAAQQLLLTFQLPL